MAAAASSVVPAVLCLGVGAALIGWPLLPDAPARATTRPSRATCAGVDLATLQGTPGERAEAFARSYGAGRITLRVDGHELVRRRDELATVDVAHLSSLLAHLDDASSVLRRVHARVRGDAPIDLPLPVELDAPRVLAWLVRVKEETDRRPRDARVDLSRGIVKGEIDGLRVDVYATLARLDRALREGATELDMVVRTEAPTHRGRVLAALDADTVLGEFETRYNPNETARDRTENLRAAASKIDGMVLLPGDTFDFNQVVGERNELNGFRSAPVIAQGELVDGMGGGTCQIAGTLHAAAFFAGLPIDERSPHSRPSYYIRMGLDAAVVYPDLNLKFRNDLPFPVVLGVRVAGGTVRAELRGADRTRMVSFVRRIDEVRPFTERSQEDPTLPQGVRVLQQRGVPGFTLHRWRVIRDLATNQAIRQSMEDSYPPTTQIWRVGTGTPAQPGWLAPAGDVHPEYVADEYLVVTQAPGVEGLQESRRAGRTGTPGWTRDPSAH